MSPVQPDRAGRWLSGRLRPSRLSIVCIPCAGHGASFFRDWQRGLPADVQLVPLALPGREKRTREKPATSAVDIARDLLDDLGDLRAVLGSRYALFGYSMGAVIGTALADELVTRQRPLPEALFVASKVPPHIARTRPPLHDLPDEELLAEVDKLDGLARQVEDDADLREWAVTLLRADLTVTEGYRPPDEMRLPFPVRAFGGAADPAVSASDLDGWRQYSDRPLPPMQYAGGHFFVKDPAARQALLTQLLSDTGAADDG